MKRSIILCLMAVCFTAIKADNHISLDVGDGVAGSEVTLAAALTCTDAITALEIQIPLTEHITLVANSATLASDRITDHRISAAVVDEVLKIYIYSLSLTPIQGSAGELFSLRLLMGREPAEYNLIPAVTAGDAQGAAVATTASGATATLLAPKLEVVTGEIDFGRVPIRSVYTRTVSLKNTGTSPLAITGFTPDTAVLSVEPATATIAPGAIGNFTLTYAPTVRGVLDCRIAIQSDAVNYYRQYMKVRAVPFSVNELHVPNCSGISDSTVTVTLRMNNMEPIVAAQCSFTMPEQLVYVDGSATIEARGGDHQITASMVGDTLTLIAYSLGNEPFTGDDGDIMSFKVRLNGRNGSYYLTPREVVLSNATSENMTSQSYRGYVSIQSPRLVSDGSLAFSTKAITDEITADYSVRNSGGVPLTIDRAAFLAEGYSVVTPLPLVVEAYQSSSITVKYSPAVEGAHRTTMQLYTNDPDNRMRSVSLSGDVYEPNTLSLNVVNTPDGTAHVAVAMDNYSSIVAMQFDVHTSGPVAELPFESGGRLASHSVMVNPMEGFHRVIVYSLSNTAVVGHEGEVMTLLFNGSEETRNSVTIQNIVLSAVAGANKVSQESVAVDIVYGNPEIHLLTYKIDGDTIFSDSIACGTALTPLAEPDEREGYTFSGWSEIPETMPAENVVIAGTFSINSYLLTYIVDGEVYHTANVEYNSPITPIAELVEEGYTFSGWSEIPENMPAEDVVITGTFSVNSYKLTLIVDGDTISSEYVDYGTVLTVAKPEIEGYTFNSQGEIPATMPAHDVVIIGSFSINSYLLTYIVDGDTVSSEPVTYGTGLSPLAEPTKQGYTFSGWSKIPETMPAHDVVITGSFIKNIITGIGNVEIMSVTVAPNPVAVGEMAYITGDFETEVIVAVEIYDTTGSLVKTVDTSNLPLTIDGLHQRGIYIIRLITANGNPITNKLIVK